jgi:CheY-like chemotaxis protein
MATLLNCPDTSVSDARPRRMPLAGMRVLAVDDDADALDMLAAVLGSAGAQVRTAGNAEEALAALPRWWPTVIVSDIGLPGRDGYELITEVRRLPGGDRIPAAALTGRATREDAAEAIAAGFQRHITKPADADELIEAVLQLARGAPRSQ